VRWLVVSRMICTTLNAVTTKTTAASARMAARTARTL
jgi:hypothetical protein